MLKLREPRTVVFSGRFFCFVCGFLLAICMAAMALSMAFPTPAMAQEELVTVTVEGVSKAESAPDAAKEIQAKAIQDTAREQVIEVIGDKRYQKNKAAVESKIVRQAVKFIPFVNPSAPVKQPDGSWKMSVELRISSESLRKMILEGGFMSESEGPASIVPLISFTDRSKGLSTRWWQGEEKDDAHKFLGQMSRTVYEKLQGEFSKVGFYLLRPFGTQASPLPEAYRIERPSATELKSIADYYQAPMALRGDVRFRESQDVPGTAQISIRLQVVQAASGRAIAEVSRAIDTDAGNYEATIRNKINAELPEIAKDLAVQVQEAWQRGTINANVVRLIVRGRLTPKELADFKSGLLRSVREVKSMRERLFEQDQVTYEIDYAGQLPQLAERMKSVEIPGLITSVSGSVDQGLVVQVKRR